MKIIDTCPCSSATANNTQWCCPNADGSAVQHFDLSFWAFEQLAHPLYGACPQPAIGSETTQTAVLGFLNTLTGVNLAC